MTGATNRSRAENIPIWVRHSGMAIEALLPASFAHLREPAARNVLVLFSGALDRFRCARRTYSKETQSHVQQSNVTQLRAVVTLMPASIHPQDAWRQVAYRQCLVQAYQEFGPRNAK
jgi:hypothetical protein